MPYDIILIVELRNRQKSNKCECAGIGRQARLRGVCFTTYGFKSRHSHHKKQLTHLCWLLFIFTVKRCDGPWRRPLRKQSCGLFLGRALMKVWRWTSRIGEDGSLTYSNHRHSQVTVISICISEYDGGESDRKTKSRYKKTTVFRESVDESMTMNKPHWRGRKFDI